MHITLFMALTINGIIADLDGGEEFLSDYGLEMVKRLAEGYGNIISGRKTYERLVTNGELETYDSLKNVSRIVLSKDSRLPLKDGYGLANSPLAAIKMLQEKGLTDAFVCGGAAANSAFMKLGLVNEIIFNYEPIVKGIGLPVFSPSDFEFSLELLSVDRYGTSGITLRYQVLNPS